MLLSAISVVGSDRHLEERHHARAVTISSASSSSDVYIRRHREVVKDHFIYVIWIEPAGSADQAILPPGVRSLPQPGWTVVSPALDALARQDPGLARMYPRRTVLAEDGVGSATELVAYLRPPPDRGLGGEDEALHFDGDRLLGDSITARVAQFGAKDGLPVFGDEDDAWWLTPLLAFVMGALPAFVLLAIGLRMSGPWTVLRQNRRRRRTGVGDPRRPGLLTSLLVVLPGMVLGSAAWLGVLAAQPETLPLTQVPTVYGRHGLTLTFAGLVVTTVMAVAAIALVLGRSRSRTLATRPVTGSWAKVRLAPLAISALLFAVHNLTPWGDGLPLVTVACVAAVVGILAALPVVLHRVGQRLRTSPRPTVELVGRDFESDPHLAARPFYGVALLIVIALTILPSDSAAEPSAGSVLDARLPSTVGVEWLDVDPGDFASFASALRTGTPFPVAVVSESDGEGHVHEEGGVSAELGASCEQLADLVAMDCADARSGSLPESAQPDIGRLVGVALGEPVEKVTLVEPRRLWESGNVMVLGAEDLASLDAATRLAAREALPAALVDSAMAVRVPSHDDQAIADNLAVRLLVVSALAALLLSIDTVIAQATLRRRRSDSLEPDPSLAERVPAGRFFFGYWSAGLFGTAIGYVVHTQSTSVGAPDILWQRIATVLLWLLLGAALGVVAIVAALRGGPASAADVRDPRSAGDVMPSHPNT